MSVSTNNLWLNFATQIQQLAAPSYDSSVEVFSFAGVTLSADLADANPTITNQTVYSIADTVPAWSASYSNGGSLSQAYNLFLSYIKLNGDPNPNLQSQISIAAGNVTSAQNNYNTVLQAAWNQWKTVTQAGMTTLPFPAWATTNYPTLAAAASALAAANQHYSQLMTQAYGPGYQQLQNAQQASTSSLNVQVSVPPYNMQVTTGSIAPAGSTSTLPGQTPTPPASALQSAYAPAYALDSSFTTVYQQWQTDSVNGKNNVNFVVTANASSQTWDNYGWSVKSEVGGFFDWLWAGGSTTITSNTQTYDGAASSMSIDVSFVGLQSFTVTPNSAWFNPSLISTYSNQLFPGAPNFFGQGGSLSLLPSQIIVGFCPTITMTLDQATYNSYKNQFQQTTTLGGGFGPFFWGEGTYSSYADKSSIQFSDQSNSITMGPIQSTVPLLLGVISSKLGS